MTDDLVKRLRDPFWIPNVDASAINEERHEAADRIEQLEAALEVYSCDCNLADEDSCEIGDWSSLSCGYRAKAALTGEKKDE